MQKNQSINPKTKHMDIRLNSVRELVNDNKIILKFVKSQYNLKNGYTKYLKGTSMDKFRNSLLTQPKDLEIY